MSSREVCLAGGSPWGFRMHGGQDQHQPLRISRVNPGSKAAQQGVREGDLISSINGKNTRELSNAEAHALLRNAGDQLKLGLNQETGSPKRRIYKSSLQENSSIETIKKTTTTKTTTTNTHIISTETKKNGIDETKNEPSYEKQNGNVNTETAADQQDKSDSDKNHFPSVDHLDYATDSESTGCLGIKMPCGSRTRRNRRNNRQRKPSQPTYSVPEDASNGSQSTEVVEKEEATTIPSSDPQDNARSEEPKQVEETKIDGASLTITTEQSLDELPYVNSLSAAQNRLRINNRHTIEKKVLHTDTQICEITTIRSAEPLEARLDHIPGVGIVESAKELSPNENGSSNVTVSEPAEPVEPLPEDLAIKVENLPGAEACMTVAIPGKRLEFLEIHEMTDSDVEFDCKSPRLQQQQEGIIIEVESDLEREPSFEEKRKDDSEGDEVDDSITWELENQLRNFIEGLKLPSSSVEKAPRTTKFLESDVNLGGRDVRGSVKSPRKRVATSLGSYQSQMSQESNRCLDIIQEEGETKSADDIESGQQHIRDFINEEIGKFRRERRDLKSVLRDQRNSLEGREEEISAFDAMESENDQNNVAETRLDKNVDVDGRDINVREKSPNTSREECNSKNKCQRDCDNNVDDKKVLEDGTVPDLPDENVEMIRNLVENLTEKVINETDFEKKGNSNYINNPLTQNETEKTEIGNQCFQNATVSDQLRNSEEDGEIEEIIRLDSDREFDDDFADHGDTPRHSIVIIDNRNSSFEDDWDESKTSFSKAIFEHEDSVENVSEACNEVLSPTENQFNVRNDNPKITNETPKSDEKLNENNDNISNESLKNSNDSNSENDNENFPSVENSSPDSDTEKSIEDVEIFDVTEGSRRNDPRAFLPFFIRGFAGGETFIPFNVKRRTNHDEDGYFPLTITEILDDKDEEYEGLEVVKSKHFSVSESSESLGEENEKIENKKNNMNSEYELASPNEVENGVASSEIIDKNVRSNNLFQLERENEGNMHTEKIIGTENRSSTERTDERKSTQQTIDGLSMEDENIEKTVESEAVEKPTDIKIFTDDFCTDPVSEIKLSNPAESQCQEPITLDTLEHLAAKITQIQERAPDPPKRSASLPRSHSSSEIPRNDRAPYIERIPPPPPTRCRRGVPTHDTRYPTDFPHCPGPAPKFAVFHQRTLNAFDFNDQLETVEFVRALLTILSNHNSTRQDVQNFLQQYDIDKLPANIRNIVDDLMAPTPSLSSENSIELSEGCVDLCNDLRIEPQRDDYKIGTGRVSAPPEIAANKSQRSCDGAARCEKLGESTHTEEYDLPWPSNKLSKTSEERTYETYTENTTETIRKETKITWGPQAMFVNERLVDDVTPAGLHTHHNSSGSKHTPDAGPGDVPKSTLLNGATPAGDHLYYVPRANPSFDPDGNSAGKFSEGQADPPDTLRELCVKKILSMPCGEKLIDEISVPKFNIFRSLKTSSESIKGKEPSKPYDRAAKHNGYAKADLPWTRKKPEAEISISKPTAWAGVPTKENPKLLVCLSPAQQETSIKTSADNLLDLHKKFINRHGYHVEHTHSVSPPKYNIDVTPKAPEPPPKPTRSSSRLMHIIKDNPVAGQDQLTNGQHGHECDNQEWLRAARLNDWLSPVHHDNGRPSGDVLIEPPHQGDEWSDKRQGEQRRVNGALIEPGPPPPTRNVTPTLRRSPLTFNSAIINKSPENGPSRPPSALGRASVDPHYVNPALIIGTRPEVPPRAKRTVTVDRDCIDTRSLFDQGSTGPAPKPKDAKHETAQEIMNNLRQLQIDAKDLVNKRRRYSLPQEYLEKQMKYIEQLENQLHEEILTEAEEKKQPEGTEKPKKTRPFTISESSFLDCPAYRLRQAHQNGDEKVEDCITEKDQWKETSNKVEDENSEYESREGSRETRKKLETGEGFYSESIEKREEQRVTSKSVVKSRRPKVERPITIAAIPTNGETFRQAMYAEYVREVQEREQRRQHKLIKISSRGQLATRKPVKRGEDYSCLNRVEQEFIEKAKSRLGKHGIRLDESDTEGSGSEPQAADAARLLVDGKELRHANKLPKHLREFLALERENHEMIAPKFKASSANPGVWSPGSDSTKPLRQASPERGNNEKDEAIPPVWTPSSAGPSPVPERKEFRPVPFESPVLSRKKIQQQPQQQPRRTDTNSPSWQAAEQRRGASQAASPGIPSRIVNSYSAPSQGLNALSGAPRLPRAQNPTITLLQKAREGQLPKGASYLEETDHSSPGRTEEKPLVSPGEVIYTLKKEYESEPETKNAPPKRMADLGPRKYKGIGPTTRGGMPIVLKSEVTENNQERWYKQMYNSLHRVPKKDDYVTIHYKPHRGTKTGYSGTSSGYLSEPEPIRSYPDRSATLDSRRHRQRNKENDFSTSTLPRPAGRMNGHYSPDTYHMNPGRIEDYEPGNSSIQDKETKEPFEQPSRHSPKSYMTHALKESGYESDSTLVFRRREDASPLSPIEQRIAYKTVQKGGDVPLHGLRKPAPERPKESPRRYVEGEVTIHYRSPVRSEAKEPLSEEELARRSAENMRRVYQEERRRKYLQELHDIDSRRHTDNFIPSQKSPIPLNRYDDFVDDLSYRSRSQEQTPEPRLVAKALYNFVGQSPRELTFRRGDIIFVRRQVDRNWYEGEHNAMVGLFPFNYVEILPFDEIRTPPKKSYEGQARAKFNFVAQTNLELSLAKGELVYLLRRVDENWWEGRLGPHGRKGIFPVSYVDVITEPGYRPETPVQSKPVASPAAHSLLSNGSSGGKLSMGPHHYAPSLPVNINATQPHYNSLPKGGNKYVAPVNETLHIDTHSEPIPYRALYNYRPQNEDELELSEGDTVYVMEKCDDGWYVGSSQRTGYFGTFPGNYVERL